MPKRRMLNQSYGAAPSQLFMALASLMSVDDLSAGVPRVGEDGMMVIQAYGECPAQCGCDVWYRLSEDLTEVLIFDPESNPGEVMPGTYGIWPDSSATSRLPFHPSLIKYRLMRYLLDGES